jgi:hypothetical protein
MYQFFLEQGIQPVVGSLLTPEKIDKGIRANYLLSQIMNFL